MPAYIPIFGAMLHLVDWKVQFWNCLSPDETRNHNKDVPENKPFVICESEIAAPPGWRAANNCDMEEQTFYKSQFLICCSILGLILKTLLYIIVFFSSCPAHQLPPFLKCLVLNAILMLCCFFSPQNMCSWWSLMTRICLVDDIWLSEYF